LEDVEAGISRLVSIARRILTFFVKWVVGLIALVAILWLLVLGINLLEIGCVDRHGDTIVSPDGRWKVVLVEQECGSAVGGLYNIVELEKPETSLFFCSENVYSMLP
jgi:hypothetical protein